MKTFLEGVEGVEESFEMSDVDTHVAVVEVEQNEDSDEERVGVGEGNYEEDNGNVVFMLQTALSLTCLLLLSNTYYFKMIYYITERSVR